MHLDRDACYRSLQSRDARFDGRFFTAVRTTGIYCRPICPARTPKFENVAFYRTALAAQQAGFRPCLRCRPESSPDLADWQGASATVARALALIAVGALDDEGTVDRLAGRLGVGDRQLRRLFRGHLGASPIAVAQTRRVLFAKQLIHETRMSMVDVALAAGFGSLRRFNQTFSALYGRPPSALRRQRSEAAPGAMDGSAITMYLSYAPPYDWPAMIDFLGHRAIPGVELVEVDRYARTVALDGRHGTVEVRPAADRPAIAATIRFPNVRALPSIVGRIRRVFDVGADVAVIDRQLADDPVMARLVAARPGLRLPGAWDGFELAIRAILGQQVTLAAARQLAGVLVGSYGEPIDGDASGGISGLTAVFPRPEHLAGADLAELGMPRARAASISALAVAALADPDLFARDRDLATAVARLTALPGVGEWTAQYIAMRALREPDAFPPTDVGLLRAMADLDGARPTPAVLLARAEAWRPWRAYAAQHLWTSISTPVPLRSAEAVA